MLSPQAARMGSVFTTLRKIGMSKVSSTANRGVTPFGVSRFFKSTQALVEDVDEVCDHLDVDYRTQGHASAAAYRVEKGLSEDPWMINLNRGNNNAWLSDSRNESEWFTGLAPKDCPGKLTLI